MASYEALKSECSEHLKTIANLNESLETCKKRETEARDKICQQQEEVVKPLIVEAVKMQKEILDLKESNKKFKENLKILHSVLRTP